MSTYFSTGASSRSRILSRALALATLTASLATRSISALSILGLEAKPQAPSAITRMPKPAEDARLMLPTWPSLTSTRSESSLMIRMSA